MKMKDKVYIDINKETGTIRMYSKKRVADLLSRFKALEYEESRHEGYWKYELVKPESDKK